MNFHRPVLLQETLQQLGPRAGEWALDLTLGGAGHAHAIASMLGSEGKLYGFDQDPEAIAVASERLQTLECNTKIFNENFSSFDDTLTEEGLQAPCFDLLLADLGVSSHQLDEPSRGFSFAQNGPLDMRMGKDGMSAHELIEQASAQELASWLFEYGQVRRSRSLARHIKEAQRAGELEDTRALKMLCERHLGHPRPGKIHPATTVFQAIRMAVNQELEVLETLLSLIPKWMKPGARIAIISFHSGEDRIVKRAFRDYAGRCKCPPRIPVCICGYSSLGAILTRKPVTAEPAEIEANPRSRSAKLRAFRFKDPTD